MKVRLKADWRELENHNHRLTDGKVYDVIGIEADDYRIIDDEKYPVVFPHEIFDIVDGSEPDDWVTNYDEDGERYSYAPEIDADGFFEDYHDGKEDFVKRFWAYIESRKYGEGDL